MKTLIEDNFDQTKLFIPPITKCISIDETAIEKWVGLTRRIMAIERGREDDDKTLIRHVYDLNAINEANKINSSFNEINLYCLIGEAVCMAQILEDALSA